MKVLVLGGDGMLGHQLLLSLRSRHDVRCTLRQGIDAYQQFSLFTSLNSHPLVEASSSDKLSQVLADFLPDVVVNCIGIVKQRPTGKESISSLEINALLPHRLSLLCKDISARLIHLSTDCVFNGKKGNYQESDPSDAEDLYGRTKFLGEVQDENCLTLRTSIIGRELSRHKSLLDWFLAQSGTVSGFRKAIYTGFTTIEMARIIEMMMVKYPEASGVYQVSSDPINKYELLLLFSEKLGHEVDVLADESFSCDRSLDSSRFRDEFRYKPPTWESMVTELNIS